MSYAVHKPKDMPRYKRLDAPDDLDRPPTEADNERLRAFFLGLTAQRKDNGK